MNLADQPVRSYSKAQQLHSNRGKPTQKELGAIRTKVRQKVNRRSKDKCEGCGKIKQACWTLENAHVEGRRIIDHLTDETDLLRLCGPSTEAGTCHHFAHTGEGSKYMKAQRERLRAGLPVQKVKEWREGK